MKPTVVQGLTGRAVPEGQERDALNNEVRPVLEAVRAAANYYSQFRASGDTTDSPSAYKTIWESGPLADGTAGVIQALVVGFDTANDTAGYGKYIGFKVVAGVVSLTASGGAINYETQAAFDAQFAVVGNSVALQVRDNGVPMKWEAVIQALEVVL